jgi:hypothetical protein
MACSNLPCALLFSKVCYVLCWNPKYKNISTRCCGARDRLVNELLSLLIILSSPKILFPGIKFFWSYNTESCMIIRVFFFSFNIAFSGESSVSQGSWRQNNIIKTFTKFLFHNDFLGMGDFPILMHELFFPLLDDVFLLDFSIMFPF